MIQKEDFRKKRAARLSAGRVKAGWLALLLIPITLAAAGDAVQTQSAGASRAVVSTRASGGLSAAVSAKVSDDRRIKALSATSKEWTAAQLRMMEEAEDAIPTGPCLTKKRGVFYYGSDNHRETWYDLDMTKAVSAMRWLGYTEEEYPYWIRSDGVKMLGPYVMVAAAYETYPFGSKGVDTSLGKGIVVDTGAFAESEPTLVDIAVDWKSR